MTQEAVMNIAAEAIWLIIKCAGPLLIVSLLVGLLISVFQTVTSIQEQTLTFLPKLVGILLVILLLSGWMFSDLRNYTVSLFQMIPEIAK